MHHTQTMRSDDAFKAGQDIRDRAFRFACRIVKFCERLYQIGGIARLMAPQLLDCGTALFPMLEEARAAESKRDFISKCSIGLKEIRETHGRLRLHEACSVGPVDEATKLRIEANELVSIVTTIVGNTRANAGLKPIRRKAATSYFKNIPNSTPNSIPNS
ncbi:MAG TPA: four helix bundle protein [Vicinamibacterales bacterium]|nr:four helix bundle protein [Vicinamibacterales bacterium]